MTKWADYLISGVRFDVEKNHVEYLEVREDLETRISSPSITPRIVVVQNIEKGTSYLTIFKTAVDPNSYVKGQEVRLLKIGAQKYLRSDGEQTAKDGLDNLPLC